VRAAGGVIKYSYRLVPGIAASIPEAAIDGLSHNPNVTMIEEDLTVYAIDAELDNCWGVERIGAGTVHAGGNRGAGVKVAIIDSGVDYNHSDLDANFDPDELGYDFVNDDDDPMDDHGHGTHVAGTVAAEDNGIGVVGVAPNADIYGLKVLSSSGSGSYSDVIAALQWAVDNGMDVTNNSYGSSGNPGYSTKMAFDNAAAAGVINVCAAGNSGAGDDTVIYPAKFESCIAVAATTSNDVRAYFSSTGPDVEISAPGYYIYSTMMGGGYGYKSGTSMACPHVSGVVALMINAGVADIRSTLATTADDLGATGWDPQYGYGLVNAVAAVGEPGEPDPVLAEFAGIPISGDVPLDVLFTDLSTGNPTDWFWTFGDGETSIAQDPSHIYTTAGTYTVSLTAVGPGGSDNETKTSYVEVTEPATPPPAPVANFVGSPTSGDAPLNVNFTDISTGDIASWSWIFGDGGSSTAQNPSHTYSSAGTYTVSLTVTNTGGSDAETKIHYITVNTPLLPDPVVSVHIGDLDGLSVKMSRGNWGASVTITVHDNNHNIVVGATVNGVFYQEGGYVELVSGVTGFGGTCTLSSDQLLNKKGQAKATFVVNNVTDTLPYTGVNHDPDGDSDGTTIVISK
jgi:PKD repeat protein